MHIYIYIYIYSNAKPIVHKKITGREEVIDVELSAFMCSRLEGNSLLKTM